MDTITILFGFLSITALQGCCFAGVVDGDCIVNNIAVQENFDLDKFSGKWYEYKWYSKTVFPASEIYLDHIHYYVPTSSDNITNYVSLRYPDDRGCDFQNHVLQKTSVPGKMIWIMKSGPTAPYWIVDTDYTQYAFVYGCSDVSVSGTCENGSAWVWSRTKNPPSIVAEREQAFYNTICINGSDFLKTEHSKECQVPTSYKMDPNQNCGISNLPKQQNLDKEKFAGMWYEMRWITSENEDPSSVLSNFMYEFILDKEGKFNMYLRGRHMQKGCIYNTNTFEPKSAPGEFIYSGRIDEYVFRDTSWIVETDYDNYAIQFICPNITDDVCVNGYGVIWSRGRSLPPTMMYKANSAIQASCLNPVAGYHIPQDNTCPPRKPDIVGCGTNDAKMLSQVPSCVVLVGLIWVWHSISQ